MIDDRQNSALAGLAAEFRREEHLLEAGRRARRQGYRRLEAFKPYPGRSFPAAFSANNGLLPMLTLGGGILGGVAGMYIPFTAAESPIVESGWALCQLGYVMEVTSQTSMLSAAFASVIALLALQRLPKLYHRLFDDTRFTAAGGYFLTILASDPAFNPRETRRFLESVSCLRVIELED